MSTDVPIFALGTVLFPGGMLSLRVFETRYVDMIRQCMREGTNFGVACIRDGAEVGEAANVNTVATIARITDFDLLEDGLLGITATGEQRFNILSSQVQPDQLLVATRTQFMDEDPAIVVPPELHHLSRIAEEIFAATEQELPPEEQRVAGWTANRIAEVLPLPLARKQYLLELADPLLRLHEVNDVVLSLSEKE